MTEESGAATVSVCQTKHTYGQRKSDNEKGEW